ncbi:hypothetical protein SLEP1_g20208 [Rubroshorea leprosula]|uniref:SAM domain-containing protein n=1 Tax=Rubroshorea leprosula TaxID=152421 RepID=A0AAV5J7Y8_9ROSI|nr:hypothetical protein SLEP1_g20208 [Rubroshorea leprosula]
MSRPRVTITLGRSGQVVERGCNVVGDSGRVSKRSMVRNGVGGMMLNGKRQQGASAKWGLGVNRREGGIAKNDLRHKLLRKRQQVQGVIKERNKRELHEKHSKSVIPPANLDMLPSMSEFNRSTHLKQIPTRGTANDLHPGDLLRKSIPSHTMTGTRGRSPERILRNSSALLPPASFDGMWQRVPTGRDTNAPRAGFYSSITNIDASRHSGLASATVKAIPETARPVARVVPSRGMIQRGSFGIEELPAVPDFLHSLGLEKYITSFQREEVDMTALKQMGDKDLKDMGLPMGPRKKILRALTPPNHFVCMVDNARMV